MKRKKQLTAKQKRQIERVVDMIIREVPPAKLRKFIQIMIARN